MTTKTRLQKLEAETGLDRPCIECGAMLAYSRAYAEYLRAKGFDLPPLKTHLARCPTCGRIQPYDRNGLDDEMTAESVLLREESWRARCEGRSLSEEMSRRDLQFFNRCDEIDRAKYGEHHDKANNAGADALEEYVRQYWAKYSPRKSRSDRR
jgi:hypothetical protein